MMSHFPECQGACENELDLTPSEQGIRAAWGVWFCGGNMSLFLSGDPDAINHERERAREFFCLDEGELDIFMKYLTAELGMICRLNNLGVFLTSSSGVFSAEKEEGLRAGVLGVRENIMELSDGEQIWNNVVAISMRKLRKQNRKERGMGNNGSSRKA